MQKKVLKSLTVPTLSWSLDKTAKNFGEIVAEPLEPGFGITFGNALRRIMLSAVEGSAVTSVIISGVNNEFSTLDGVIEDTLQIVLNIKRIIVKNATGEPGVMTLRKGGVGPVTAGDILTDDHLEVVNKDLVLANLSPQGKIEIQFFVETGRGYQFAQWPGDKKLQEDGKIFVDAMFSPVVRVEYRVEKTRVGQSIDYDKLIMGIHTNGAMKPDEVLHYATSVLRSQFEHFLVSKGEIAFNDVQEPVVTSVKSTVVSGKSTIQVPVDLFLKPIEELELSVRAHNCLIGSGLTRVIDLVNLSDDDTLKIKNFGRKSLREVKEVLAAFGLRFGMNVKELDLKRAMKQQGLIDVEV